MTDDKAQIAKLLVSRNRLQQTNANLRLTLKKRQGEVESLNSQLQTVLELARAPSFASAMIENVTNLSEELTLLRAENNDLIEANTELRSLSLATDHELRGRLEELAQRDDAARYLAAIELVNVVDRLHAIIHETEEKSIPVQSEAKEDSEPPIPTLEDEEDDRDILLSPSFQIPSPDDDFSDLN